MLQAEDLQRTLTALLEWANSRNVVLGALDARSTSLQEAFLAVAASSGEPVNVNDNGEGVAA
jgi:ABC-2 type transport system ATP-binding protein